MIVFPMCTAAPQPSTAAHHAHADFQRRFLRLQRHQMLPGPCVHPRPSLSVSHRRCVAYGKALGEAGRSRARGRTPAAMNWCFLRCQSHHAGGPARKPHAVGCRRWVTGQPCHRNGDALVPEVDAIGATDKLRSACAQPTNHHCASTYRAPGRRLALCRPSTCAWRPMHATVAGGAEAGGAERRLARGLQRRAAACGLRVHLPASRWSAIPAQQHPNAWRHATCDSTAACVPLLEHTPHSHTRHSHTIHTNTHMPHTAAARKHSHTTLCPYIELVGCMPYAGAPAEGGCP